ncbi:hypothetical protein H4Q26_013538 [Puccinia striiformis f. sp. tritici PST-130]|nr:hypothetical protein H4Q26_013538 [Puccinia striiformis f. sp. tritici PST-130]
MASFFNNTNKQIPDSAINWSLLAGAESTKPSSSSDSSSSSTTTPKFHLTMQQTHQTSRPHPPSSPSLSSSMNKTSKSISKAEPWMPKMSPTRNLERSPEVRKLMGYTWTTKWVVLFVVSVQLSIAAYFGLRSEQHAQSAWSWKFFLTAYIQIIINVSQCLISSDCKPNLFLAIHEITHNLAFKKILHNKLLALFSNLPIGVPYAMVFKRYHLEHHKSLGEDGIDTDLPTRLELLCLKNVLGKTFFALAAVMYLIMSSFFAGSLHPCAAHFIAEHYVWNEDGGEQETWSYYGPLNILAYNTPRFPSIPWTRLPELKAMASEYYDPLPQHYSWPLVIVKFIFDNRVGLFRVSNDFH